MAAAIAALTAKDHDALSVLHVAAATVRAVDHKVLKYMNQKEPTRTMRASMCRPVCLTFFFSRPLSLSPSPSPPLVQVLVAEGKDPATLKAEGKGGGRRAKSPKELAAAEALREAELCVDTARAQTTKK